MSKNSVRLLFSIVIFNSCSDITPNYFFDNSEVAGLTKKEWLAKCDDVLTETQLHQVIFNIKGLCTQLRCLRDNNLDVYLGFDYCMKSSTRCIYSEPDPTLPYPECCPRRQCSGLKWKILDYKTFVERRHKKRNMVMRKKKSQLLK
ncbi:hypothetical protein ILUMI_13493 [Ignelater luminosus]|uniref:Single domain-containing protein n=1 Tax=Ignelater luminosus TaxID=2038154 RepID=A0A8K0G5S2_IGNLU|nr:hypothetical protein ILUMI_13493 [Ignelater luminosus]